MISLARSAHFIKSPDQAESVLRLLGAYLRKGPTQTFPAFSGVREIEPSPWHVSTRLVTRAILSLGASFPDKLRADAENLILRYLNSSASRWKDPEVFTDPDVFFPLLFSFLGFLEALTQQVYITSYPTLATILARITETISTEMLLQVETTVAQISADVPAPPKTNGNGYMVDPALANGSNPEQSIDETIEKQAFQQAVNGETDISRWQYYIFSYLRAEQQLGAMLLNYYVCSFARAITAKIVNYAVPNAVTSFRARNNTSSLLNKLISRERLPKLKGTHDNSHPDSASTIALLTTVSQLAIAQIHSLDEGADYIELASPERIALAYATKVLALDIVGVATSYRVLESEVSLSIIRSSILHEHGMSNSRLALAIFKLGAFLCSLDEETSGLLVRYFPHFIAIPSVQPPLVRKCAKALVYGLRNISQDVIVSTIYTLVNIVTVNRDATLNLQNGRVAQSTINNEKSFSTFNDPEGHPDSYTFHVNCNAIAAIVTITLVYDDPQISALAATVLNQKLNVSASDLDREVAFGVAKLASYVPDKEFLSILRSFQNLAVHAFQTNDKKMRAIVKESLCRISSSLNVEHPLYETYLSELLQSIVDRGDVQELEHHRPHVEISATANEIALYLAPLARLLPKPPKPHYKTGDAHINSLFRNTWYNMVVHGFSQTSEWTQKYKAELEIIAHSTPPLVSTGSSNKIESDLELNTVLQRGSSHHNVNNQKEIMDSLASSHIFDFKTLQYPKLMFLAATILLEGLRANTGNCSKILLYFGDPGIRAGGETRRYMRHIATDVTNAYIQNVIRGNSPMFTSDLVASQVKKMLTLCCHRVKAIQEQAFESCSAIINAIPSSLCSEISLFTLLDLLSLLWKSCLDAETDEYEPRTTFTAPKSNVRIELSDSYDQRRESLHLLHTKARAWVRLALLYTAYDVKSILTSYMSGIENYSPADSVVLGYTFALEMGGTVTSRDRELSVLNLSNSNPLSTNTSAGFLSQYIWRRDFHASVASDIISKVTPNFYDQAAVRVRKSLSEVLEKVKNHHDHVHHNHVHTNPPARPNSSEARTLLFKASGYMGHPVEGKVIARLCVQISMRTFTESSIQFGISLWSWAINEYPSLKAHILSEVAQLWEWSVKERLGLYTRKHDLVGPAYAKMEYAPTNKAEINHDAALAARDFACHQKLIRYLSSSFQSIAFESKHYLKLFSRMILVGLQGLSHASLHPYARAGRFELIKFALEVLETLFRFGARLASYLKHLIVSSALTWFAQPAQWPFGGNRLNLKADMDLLSGIATVVKNMRVKSQNIRSASGASSSLHHKRDVLLFFLNDELTRMSAWSDPLQLGTQYRDVVASATASDVAKAWSIDPPLAVYLVERQSTSDTVARLEALTAGHPGNVVNVPEALKYFISGTLRHRSEYKHFVVYWRPVSPIESINLFLPKYGSDSLLLQYAMRSLESHDVNVTFFYVPQLVQTLRYDAFGYVERFILETAKISQLFAHQIIWNILANLFTDGDLAEGQTEEDEINPTLQRVLDRMISNFSPEDREFYEREFTFFNTVTSISKSLLPLLRKTKAEKKIKIDEEIAKINVDVGVYLPSNPDGIVIDIDRKSGRPLQSHAKTPFMATFRIQREIRDLSSDLEDDKKAIANGAASSGDDDEDEERTTTVQVWQSAIFKVGDDCRQDVMALQLISVFRSIFNSSGLDLYVFPYRVTATAPGNGVIDVLPNSISRDMLGREAVNGLYEYFTTKFGGEDSIQFQQARNNFVKSLAAYSVISYLIQFKDRHNGNIMYDDKGHILHIDFGFCFDIVPGGVKFEAAPFKLTHEMVLVMGGSTNTQAYRWFEELAVKAFLASRPHAETIIQAVVPMLDSGLPCFKGEATIRKLRARFALEKSERDAALFMRQLIKQSYESVFTKGYDEFQRLTNGIPY